MCSFDFFLFLPSLVVPLVILRGCHLLRLSGSFNFDVVLPTLPTFMSAWCHRYIVYMISLSYTNIMRERERERERDRHMLC